MSAIIVRLEMPPAYRQAYRSGTVCLACEGRQWWIGRSSAECAFCGYALPLARRLQPNWLTPAESIAVR